MKKIEFDSTLMEFWNNYGRQESIRERKDPRKKVHTDLIWREINRCIGGRKSLTILDAGAGPGRFSIPLAERGYNVVHLDISEKMIEIAREEAKKKNLENIEFIHWDICKGFKFIEKRFDLVLCLDSPLSYCYKNYNNVLRELIEITKEKIILCVINRYGVILEGAVNFDLMHFGKIKTVREVFKTGTLVVNEDMKKLLPNILPSWHAFTPEELQQLIIDNGCKIERMLAPGTLARTIGVNLLKALFKNNIAYEDFLDFAEEFDSNRSILGVGAVSAGGLLLTAERTHY